MSEITRIGVDLAKNVIQIHAVDAAGKVITTRALARDKFMPGCATAWRSADRHGSQLQRIPLGAQTRGPRPGCLHDDGPYEGLPDLQMGASTAGKIWLAEGRGRPGQQERAHPVGGVCAGKGV
jgi:hypothetical protein